MFLHVEPIAMVNNNVINVASRDSSQHVTKNSQTQSQRTFPLNPNDEFS